MSAPTVSCIVPAFNAERFLRQALDSVFAQTYRPLEVIVVDDGSTDATAAVAEAAGVVLLRQENAGFLAARDAGLAAASGEYVAFLDADDLWVADKIERQVAALRANPALDLCVGHFLNFWDADVAHEAARYHEHRLARLLSGYIVAMLLARRDAFTRFGTFTSGGNRSDTAWFARAIALGARLETLPDLLLHRRVHAANVSRAKPYSLDGLFDLIRARRTEA